MKKFIFLLFLMSFLLLTNLEIEAAQVHRVQPGESLFTIARDYGITRNEIINLNKLPDENQIFINQVLIIPDKENDYLYRVKPGDTLYRISQNLGISLRIIAHINNLSDTNNLYVRQPLYIPPSSSTYEVQAGDTLFKIANKFNIPLNSLIEANIFYNHTMIIPGQQLLIPEINHIPDNGGPGYSDLFADTYYLYGQPSGNKVSLTFDDGPDPLYTPQVLDVLQKYNVKATFFVMGDRVRQYPEIARRIVNEGHIIANHSWSHPNLNNVSKERFENEVYWTEGIIKNTVNLSTKLIRPPYGAVSHTTLERLRNMGYKVINWSVDSIDWRDRDVDQILINTLPGVNRGSIILMHSAGGRGHSLQATVDALPELIETLQMRGVQFVNLDQLLNIQPYK